MNRLETDISLIPLNPFHAWEAMQRMPRHRARLESAWCDAWLTIQAEPCGFKRAVADYESGQGCEHALRDAVLTECDTAAQWQWAIGEFGERDCGQHVSDWADDSVNHAWQSAGAARIILASGESVIAQWSDQGFWSCWVSDCADDSEWLAICEEYEYESEDEESTDDE